uniref:Microbial-type PARG catalytic domain-containing protein n=1 Tax=viral metagenome TaxID=1070528 RepID=A0A6C0E843_9ZZZZ
MGDDDYTRDTRRKDRGQKKYEHFKNGKHTPRTLKDRIRDSSHQNSKNESEDFNEVFETKGERSEWASETLQIISEYFSKDPFVIETKYYPQETPLANKTFPDQDGEVHFLKTKTVDLLWDLDEETLKNIAVLNFASAKNPGGGFLKGSPGQEESLAMCSGLYPSLHDGPGKEMYTKNEADNNNCIYRSDAIYSPNVPLFRHGDGSLVSDIRHDHRRINVISMPAVNYGAYSEKKDFSEQEYDRVMAERVTKLFHIALENGCTGIILGPWGCGVFRGNLGKMMRRFATEPLLNKFKEIYFISTSESEVKTMEFEWDQIF